MPVRLNHQPLGFRLAKFIQNVGLNEHIPVQLKQIQSLLQLHGMHKLGALGRLHLTENIMVMRISANVTAHFGAS